MGQSLPKRDVSVTSVNPSTSDMTSRRRQRRNGPQADVTLAPDKSKRCSLAHIFCSDMFDLDNTLERNLRELVSLFDALSGWSVKQAE